ncbi:MAG: hypothetical protein AAFV80_01835 [Bacteroidota bacterium]
MGLQNFKVRQLLSFLLLFTLLNACQEQEVLPIEEVDNPTPTPVGISYPNVDERLWPYYSQFEQEAAMRGLSIDLAEAEIEGQIAEIHEDGVAGQCAYSSAAPNLVTVDATFWNETNALFREFIIYHELGHCVLDRDHREDADVNGRCISIMRSGLGDCRDAYHSGTREDYIDELFFPASVPSI